MLFQVPLSTKLLRVLWVPVPHSEELNLELRFFGLAAPALACRKRIVALPLHALPVSVNWQLVLQPFFDTFALCHLKQRWVHVTLLQIAAQPSCPKGGARFPA